VFLQYRAPAFSASFGRDLRERKTVMSGTRKAGFALQGRLVAKPGRRDELAAAMVESAIGMEQVDGCYAYVVYRSLDDPDSVHVTELWRDEQAHRACLGVPAIRAAIQRNMPLIARFEGSRLEPLGGPGLPNDSSR
jgi:quinol monooxygenase YgiN